MAGAVCCTPAPPSEHYSQGVIGTIGGLTAYLNKPASAKSAIIFASDIFGFDAPLLRKLADRTAATGYYVVVPDYFHGKPFTPENPADPFASFGPWIAVNHPDASIDVTKTIVKELKSEGFKSIGLAGFCWGGRLGVKLASDETILKSVVLLHPSLTTVEDVQGVKVSTAVLGSEIDDFTSPAMLEEFKTILEAKPITSFTKLFLGQTHGWSIRYDVNDAHQAKGAEEAHNDMLEFFTKTL